MVLRRFGSTSSHDARRRYQAAFSASSDSYLCSSQRRKRPTVWRQKQNSGFEM